MLSSAVRQAVSLLLIIILEPSHESTRASYIRARTLAHYTRHLNLNLQHSLSLLQHSHNIAKVMVLLFAQVPYKCRE